MLLKLLSKVDVGVAEIMHCSSTSATPMFYACMEGCTLKFGPAVTRPPRPVTTVLLQT